MKKFTIFLCSLAMVIGLSGAAAAAPYTWTDTLTGPVFVNWWDTISYTHNIADGPDGFNGILMGGDDVISDYSLVIAMHDDGGFLDFWETAFVSQPGVLGDGYYNFAYSSNEFGISLLGLLQLNSNGTLDVSITSEFGDFWVDSSYLVARGDNGDNTTAPVPEPATMLLLGSGLLGSLAFGRKRFKK